MINKKQFYTDRGFTKHQYQKALRVIETEKAFVQALGNIVTKHHVIPSEHGGTNDKENLRQIRWKYHKSHHRIFGTRLPHEQTMANLEFNSQVFTESMVELTKVIREEIDTLLADHDVYKNGLWQPNE